MIQEELTKLANEADDDEDEGEAGKDENQSTEQKVEAWPKRWDLTVSKIWVTHLPFPMV